jgi:hypothetical protein
MKYTLLPQVQAYLSRQPRDWRPNSKEHTWKTLSATLIISGFAIFSSSRIVVLDKSIAQRYAVEKVYHIRG